MNQDCPEVIMSKISNLRDAPFWGWCYQRRRIFHDYLKTITLFVRTEWYQRNLSWGLIRI